MPSTRGRASDRAGKQSGFVVDVCKNKDKWIYALCQRQR